MFVVPENEARPVNRPLWKRFYDFERTQMTTDLADMLFVEAIPALLSRWTSPQVDPMAAVANIVIEEWHIPVMSVPNRRGRLYSLDGIYPDVGVDYSELIPRKVKRVRRTRKRTVSG